jgi:two-component system NtrC family sensor kinase
MDHREFPVLYVDDEPDNLRVFELSFRREFSILTAGSPEEGLRMLHENPVAVILSDYKMPGMNGVEFLAQAREIDDRCIRMLVTAYGDVDILGDAVNDGRIYNYIAKPWEPEDMKLRVRRAIETYAIERERAALLGEMLLLNRLSQSLHRELNLDRLLQRVMEAIHTDLHYDGVALALLDADSEQLTWMGLKPDDGVANRVRDISLTAHAAPNFFDKLLTGQAQSLQMDDIAEMDEPVRDWLTEVSADEILAMPLIGKSEVVGMLAVDQRSGGRRFGADDRTMLDGLSTQVVIALENARVVEALSSTREQVKRADRLGTLGTLAAGLAHEINNPLVSINTFLSLAPEKRYSNDEEFWGRYYELAGSELERIRVLVATMSHLARGGMDDVVPEPVDLSALASKVVALMQPESREEGVELSLKDCSEMLPVYGVRDHLQQVLLNLVCNALHATPPGGKVRVELGLDRDHPRDIMCMDVVDDGEGITPEHAEQIFDPFFTTKDPDKGTGLGLMITHQIVCDHGGAIEVRSQPENGSSFRVKLPVKGMAGR